MYPDRAQELLRTKYVAVKSEIDRLALSLPASQSSMDDFHSRQKLRPLHWSVRGTAEHHIYVGLHSLKRGTTHLPYCFLIIDEVLVAWHKLPSGPLRITPNMINDRPLTDFELVYPSEAQAELESSLPPWEWVSQQSMVLVNL